MDEKQYQALIEKVGVDAAAKIRSEMANYEAKAKELAENAVKNGGVTKENLEEYKNAAQVAIDTVKEICAKQGTTINELSNKLNSAEVGSKSIAEVLHADNEELRKVYQNGSGSKTYMIRNTEKGFVMKPFDTTKTAGVTGTIDGLGSGVLASISQSMDAASLLRLGGNSPIISQYRNNAWVFDLVNLQNAGFDMPFAMWYEEQAKSGGSTAVLEGGTKPISQYAYALKTATYKKEATLIGFTEEFNLDFARLQSDILGKGRTDVINRINTATLARIISAATAYSTGANFVADVTNVNDFDAIAAMAAQVDNATFGGVANAAVMSTFKKYKTGIAKTTQGAYLNPPDVIGNIAMVGNPAMGDDDVLVGDFKQYNIILRGGLIVRVGYNGTDFAENKFSVVMEQFYYDYISAIRAVAIVKGTTFATVKAAISA